MLTICPACGSKKITSVRSFPTLAEPAKAGEAPISIGITIRQCEKCGVDFPAVVSRRKYSLVPEKEIQQLTRELSKLKEENRNLQENLSELARKQAESRNNLLDVRQRGELTIMREKVNVLGDEVSYLRGEKRQLKWLFSTLQLAAPPN